LRIGWYELFENWHFETQLINFFFENLPRSVKQIKKNKETKPGIRKAPETETRPTLGSTLPLAFMSCLLCKKIQNKWLRGSTFRAHFRRVTQ
jgi:hypothetical protein